MNLLNIFPQRYIRSGDMLQTYNYRGEKQSQYQVRIEGFGRYAAVFPAGNAYGAIRRDGIRKDAAGRWFYRYGY